MHIYTLQSSHFGQLKTDDLEIYINGIITINCIELMFTKWTLLSLLIGTEFFLKHTNTAYILLIEHI